MSCGRHVFFSVLLDVCQLDRESFGTSLCVIGRSPILFRRVNVVNRRTIVLLVLRRPLTVVAVCVSECGRGVLLGDALLLLLLCQDCLRVFGKLLGRLFVVELVVHDNIGFRDRVHLPILIVAKVFPLHRHDLGWLVLRNKGSIVVQVVVLTVKLDQVSVLLDLDVLVVHLRVSGQHHCDVPEGVH